MSKYLKIAQINQENYISNSLAASRYPPEKTQELLNITFITRQCAIILVHSKHWRLAVALLLR